jgi:large subunit ribosomal protein L5
MLDTANYTPRLKTLYRETIKPAMKEEFGYKPTT